MSAPREHSPREEGEGPGYTEQGEAAEQSAFEADGQYSGGGFAAGPEDLTGADGEQPTDG